LSTSCSSFYFTPPPPPSPTLFPYTTLFRSQPHQLRHELARRLDAPPPAPCPVHDAAPSSLRPLLAGHPPPAARPLRLRLRRPPLDRKSTRLNSSHLGISYAVFCLKKKKT